MPEGDTIFRSAERLSRALSGRVLTHFETVFADLAAFDEASPLIGRTVLSVRAQGKHLLMDFSPRPLEPHVRNAAGEAGCAVTASLTLRTHMRMNGAWHLYRVGERWFRARSRMRLVLCAGDLVAVAFDVPVAELRATAPGLRNVDRALSRLGPDYLADNFDAARVLSRLRAHADEEIAVALLDQSIAAGVGNVFKSEVLFACGVDPFARVGALPEAVQAALIDEARRQLRRNVRSTAGEGPHFYDGHRYTTEAVRPATRHAVYGRAAAPCVRCGARIRVEKQGLDARLTFFCPVCQGHPPSPPQAPQPTPKVRLGGLARRR